MDEVLVMSVLEAFEKKKMIRFKSPVLDVPNSSNGEIPTARYGSMTPRQVAATKKKLRKRMAEWDREDANLSPELDLTKPGPPLSQEEWIAHIEAAESEESFTWEEFNVFLDVLKEEGSKTQNNHQHENKHDYQRKGNHRRRPV